MFSLWKQQQREAASKDQNSPGKVVLAVDPQYTSFGEQQAQDQHPTRRTVERLRRQVSEAFAPSSSFLAPPTAIECSGEKMFPRKSPSVGVGEMGSSVSGVGDGDGARPGAATTCEEKPRRPWSSYNFFFRDERVKMLKESKKAATDLTRANEGKGRADGEQETTEEKSADEKEPARALGAVSFQELGKIIGRKWRSADPETLAKYKQLAKEDSMRYRREMDEYYERQEALLNSYTGKLVSKDASQDAAPPPPLGDSQVPAVSREAYHEDGQGDNTRKRLVDQLYRRDVPSHTHDEESVIRKGLRSISDPLNLSLPLGSAWRDPNAVSMSRPYPTIHEGMLQQQQPLSSANHAAAEIRASRDLLALEAQRRSAIQEAYGELTRRELLRESSHLEAIRDYRHLPASVVGAGPPPSLLHPSVRDLFGSTSVGFQGWSASEIDALAGEVALRRRQELERLLLRRETAATNDAILTRHLLEKLRRSGGDVPGLINPTRPDQQLGGGDPLDRVRSENALRNLQSGIPPVFDRDPLPDASPRTDQTCTDHGPYSQPAGDVYDVVGFQQDPSSYHRRDDDYDSAPPRKYARGA